MQHPLKKKEAKRPGRLWIIAAAVLALAAAAVFAVTALRKQAAESVPVLAQSPAEAAVQLAVRPSEELVSAVISPAGSEPYEVRMQDGHLFLVREDGLHETDADYAEQLISVLTQIAAEDTITEDAAEAASALADMGLDPAQASARIRYADGREELLEVGITVPGTPYSYMRWSGAEGIYACDPGVMDVLTLTAKHLLPVRELSIEPSLVQTLRITNADGERAYSFSGGTGGRQTEPFAYPLSSESSDALLTALQSLRLGIAQEPVTPENGAAYAFDDPLCVLEIRLGAGTVNVIGDDGALATEEREPQAVKLVIGRAEGDFFYTCAYEGDAYLTSRFLTEAFVSGDADGRLTRNPADMGSETLASVEMITNEKRLAVTADGSETLEALGDRLAAFTTAGALAQKDIPPADASPRMTITLTTKEGTTRVIEFYRMDVFSDAVALDGVFVHYAHADEVDALMRDE